MESPCAFCDGRTKTGAPILWSDPYRSDHRPGNGYQACDPSAPGNLVRVDHDLEVVLHLIHRGSELVVLMRDLARTRFTRSMTMVAVTFCMQMWLLGQLRISRK